MDDTDTLLAMFSSLVEPTVSDPTILLDALVQCEGSVQDAAKLLSESTELKRPRGKKRKRTAGLDQWLSTSPTKSSASGRCASSSKLSSKHVHCTRPSPAPFKHETSSPGPSSSKKPLSHLSEAPSSFFVHSSLSEAPGTVTGSTTASPSKVKVVTNDELMTMLRPPNSMGSSKSSPSKCPPLTLATPQLVAQHTPCTLHPSILPPELACRLFYTMLDASRNWQRNRWWLFDRLVESPHRTSFYTRRSNALSAIDDHDMQEAAQYWYNGRQTDPPSSFSPAMEEACEIIERVVNAEMRRRKRFPLEWGGGPLQGGMPLEDKVIWRANVAAANCYEGAKESVGFHSDQLTYLGPYPTIASLSLGTSRLFRLREVIPVDDREKRSPRTYNIPLSHNTLIIMHASTQETFKHAVPPQSAIDLFHPPFPPPEPSSQEIEDSGLPVSASNARINITFRFYRPDFRAETTPRCKCGVPCILRPDMKNRYADTATSYTATGEEYQSMMRDKGSMKDLVAKYWWTCYAGAQNEGKGCGFWKTMDVKAEGRGPFVGPI
ncbi:hypothetical protein AcW1_005818 [Taiwanofungus camphoratus]|nr:hypothetical protein AcW1_005818 [Antrodia cinnamomea]